MKDDTFARYQELRHKAEKELQAAIFQWALNEAPEYMKIEAIREISRIATFNLNHSTRLVYDMAMASKAAARSGGDT